MKFVIKNAVVLCFILILICNYRVSADSYYSSIGLGLPRYYVSQKATGMGGTGIAVVDRLALNTLNLAANDIQGMTTLGVNLEYEYVENKDKMSHVFTRNGNAAGMQFFVPLKKQLTFVALLRPLTTSRYTVTADSSISGNEYTRTVKGTGGMSAAGLGLSYLSMKKFALAAQIDFNFGSYNEQWEIDFYPVDFRDTSDKFNSFLWGIGFNAGAMVWISKSVTLGAVYRSASTLNLENRATLGNGTKIEPDSLGRKLYYPSALGIGAAFDMGKWLFALDYYTQFWDMYELNGVRRSDLKPYWRIGSGIEFVDKKEPLEKYFRRINYRIGVYHAQLPFTNQLGDAVQETFVSVGLGFPFVETVGRVDIAFEFGQRGDAIHFPYQDKIYRISGSIIGGERWFQRRY